MKQIATGNGNCLSGGHGGMQLAYGRKLLRYSRNLVFGLRLVDIEEAYLEASPLSSRANTPG